VKKDEKQWGVDEFLYLNKEFMRNEWGVEELSNIEDYQLRNIAEQVIKEYKESRKMAEDGLTKAAVNPEEEIAYRWLLELYDINRGQVKDFENFKRDLRIIRDRAHLL